MFTDIFREIFFPRRCLGCGIRGPKGTVCVDCFRNIPVNNTLFCGQCRARLPENKKICHPDFPYLLGATGEYAQPLLKELIHTLKFRRDRIAATALGALLAVYVHRAELDLANFTIVPLPLSKRRFRERGFNQAELIARAFVNISRPGLPQRPGLDIFTNLLIRTRHATPQSETHSAAERQSNVQNAFTVLPGMPVPKNILLIDDVVTSGATLQTAASALKHAGARHILALACAKV